ncbi:MAG: thioredoxin domain-containing protein [Acidobacteriota bacterium]
MDHDARRNRLAGETSPYLLQHSGNPVDWRPWGPEALELARREGTPIFLSIGYSACHWCHVMERESFEDEAAAEFLNRHFVPIKVDREERPDIDAVYMNAVQAMTGRGGWPLSVFLTPDLEPFFGGTYFPPERRHGMPSFRDVLLAVEAAWRERRGEVVREAASLAARLAALSAPPHRADLDVARGLREALEDLASTFDARAGGFGGAPKFPTPSRLFFLLERALAGSAAAREMLSVTLDGMAAGGMRDWVGGGFHRYSVDAQWLIPHFEKMLHDNALLARAYGAAGLLLGRPEWVEVARDTADYLVREMRGPEGGFLASTDADTEGEEGRTFTWTAGEVRGALAPDEAATIVALCRLDGPPNFEGGRSVLRPALSGEQLAAATGLPADRALAVVARARLALRGERARRAQPATDDKRLAGWNGMAMWSLAWLGAAFDEPRYTGAAARAAEFVLREMRAAGGGLARSWRGGRTSGAETLEDVAWVSAGLVELYQADGAPRWLDAALALVEDRLPAYRGETGALYDAPSDGEALPLRPRSPLDGATPASPAVMASTLRRLAVLTGRAELEEAAREAVGAESGVLSRAPDAASSLLGVAADLAAPATEVVVVGDPSWPSTRALLAAARRAASPSAVIVPSPSFPLPAHLIELVPLFAGREHAPAGQALAYHCVGGACRLPTSEPEALGSTLRVAASSPPGVD